MDERPGVRIGVIDLDLLARQAMLERIIFDALEGQRTRCIEAHGFEIARDNLHRRDPAVADRSHERLARRERSIAPETKPCGVAEIGRIGGAGRAVVEDPRTRLEVLEAHARKPLFGALLPPEYRLRPRRVRHLMGLVEGDDAFEIGSQPSEDLLEPRLTIVALRSQRRIGEKEDAALHFKTIADRCGIKRLDVDREAAKRGPVAPRIFKEARTLRDPDRAPPTPAPLVHDTGCNLPSLANAGPVADHEARAVGRALGMGVQQRASFIGRKAPGQIALEGLACIDDGLELRVRQGPDRARRKHRPVAWNGRQNRRHRHRLDKAIGMRRSARNAHALHLPGDIDADRFLRRGRLFDDVVG